MSAFEVSRDARRGVVRLLAGGVGGIGVATALAAALLWQVNALSYRGALIGWFVVFLVATLSLGFVHAWADAKLAQADALSRQIAFNTVRSEVPPRSAACCVYCGENDTRVLCKSCKLMQWSKLSSYGFSTIVAGFVAVHRWQTLAAALSLVAGSAVAVVAHTNQRENSDVAATAAKDSARREVDLANARAAAEAMYQYRGALLLFETTCANPSQPQCRELLDEFRKGYYRVSWEAPQVLSYLHHAICSNDAKLAGSPARPPICAFMKTMQYERIIDKLNADFREYMNAAAGCVTSATKSCVAERRTRAHVLYENGRTVGCAIAEVIYDVAQFGQEKTFSTFQSCERPEWRTHQTIAADAPQKSSLRWTEWPLPEAASEEGAAAKSAALSSP